MHEVFLSEDLFIFRKNVNNHLKNFPSIRNILDLDESFSIFNIDSFKLKALPCWYIYSFKR